MDSPLPSAATDTTATTTALAMDSPLPHVGMMIFVVSMAGVRVLQSILSRQPVLLGVALRFTFLRIDGVCLLGHLVPSAS